jgi:hypothetical protein
MFHVFQMYVVYVSSGCCKSRSGVVYVVMTIHVYCKYMFQMFQLFQTYVASVSSRCCICCRGYTRMLQVCFPNVSAVLSGHCMFSSRCCICCSDYTRMLQMYVPNVSPISDVYCKCSRVLRLYMIVTRVRITCV